MNSTVRTIILALLAIRNELNAAGQRGFNAATALHLGRRYQ